MLDPKYYEMSVKWIKDRCLPFIEKEMNLIDSVRMNTDDMEYYIVGY